MLRGRSDLAVLWDIRVHPDARGRGIGRELFQAALAWSKTHNCKDLHVETQDINVAACRFYKAMGCEIESITPNAYGPELDETMIVWHLSLP